MSRRRPQKPAVRRARAWFAPARSPLATQPPPRGAPRPHRRGRGSPPPALHLGTSSRRAPPPPGLARPDRRRARMLCRAPPVSSRGLRRGAPRDRARDGPGPAAGAAAAQPGSDPAAPSLRRSRRAQPRARRRAVAARRPTDRLPAPWRAGVPLRGQGCARRGPPRRDDARAHAATTTAPRTRPRAGSGA